MATFSAHASNRRPGVTVALVGTCTAFTAGVVATLVHPAVLVAAALVIAAPFAIAHSRWGIATGFALALYIPAPALYASSIGPVPLGPAIGAALVATAVCARVLRSDTWAVDHRAAGSVLVVCGAALVGGVLAAPEQLQSTAVLAAVWIGAFWIGSLLGHDRSQVERLLWIAVPIAALAVVEAVLGRNPYTAMLGAVRFSADQAAGFHRSTATLGHPLVAGTAFTAMAVLALTAAPARARMLAPVFLLAAATTVSRSSVVGAAAAVCALLLVQRQGRGRLLALVAVTLVVGVGVASQLPLVRESFENRVLTQSYTQASRENGYARVLSDIGNAPVDVAFGNGLRSSQRELQAAGGNVGVSTYDNQLISLVYDAGLVPLLIALGLAAAAVRTMRVEMRTRYLPALCALGAMLLFFDAFYWFSTAAIFFAVLGATTARPRPAPGSLA